MLAQHRVNLAGFLAAPEAASLTRDFERRLRALGVDQRWHADKRSMDIWFPSREDRERWSPSQELFVAVASGVRATRAFSTSGAPVTLESNLRATASGAILMVEPSTPTPRRRPYALKAGQRSVSSGEDWGALLVSVNQSGDTTLTHLDAVGDAPLRPTANSSGFNGVSLKGLMMPGATDFLSMSNPLELRFRAKLRRTIDNSEIRSATLFVDGLNDFVGSLDLPIINAVPRPGAFVELYVYEEDGAWGNDDLGTYTFTAADPFSLNWNSKNAFFPTLQAINTQLRCNYISPVYGTFLCPWNLNAPPVTTVTSWREVNFNVAWTPNQPPPPTLGISGPLIVQAGTAHTYSVNFIPGGTAPYSYRWYRDGVLVGLGPTATLGFPTPSTFHNIVVDVTDGYDYWQQREFSISVNTGQCDPGDPNCMESIRSRSSASIDR
jgi:hypothetical protein